MTSQECESRDQRIIESIQTVFSLHESIRPYAGDIHVVLEEGTLVLTGTLPSEELREQLIPAVRKAGVLSKVSNRIDVAEACVE